MKKSFLAHIQNELQQIKEQSLYKDVYRIASSQDAHIQLDNGKKLINFCANNYLGLANHPDIIKAAQEGLSQFGYGMASVRFICGTQTIHTQLEEKISQFLETESTILYPSCFDANGGLFETILGAEDAIISDQLNHASIIDGVRLCKAQRFRYANNDMQDLETQLKNAAGCRFKLIATDGVFSMDGIIANLKGICDLADRYGALVMVDDCHATGFMGENGKGTPEHCGVMGRIDILTGTLGKALGGASGGYTSGKKEIIELLRQRSRPYLFSNTVAPSIVCASLKVLEMMQTQDHLRKKLHQNSSYFREKMHALGFELVPGSHPIIPVMLHDASIAKQFERKMVAKGIYVVSFSYPVVPQGKARIRTQISAAHSKQDLDAAIKAFEEVGKELGVLLYSDPLKAGKFDKEVP